MDSLIQAARYVGDSIGAKERLHFLDSAIQGKHLSANDRFRVYTMRHHTYLHKLFDYKNALLYADSMLWIVTNFKVKDPGDKQFTSYKQLAETQYVLEQYKAAYDNYEIARHIADTVKSPAVKSKYFASIGMAYYKEEKYADAARFFVNAYKMSLGAQPGEILNFVYYQQEELANAGLAYAMAGNRDSSLFYFRKAIGFIEQKKASGKDGVYAWNEALSVVYGNMASLYNGLGTIDSAQHYFVASINASKASGRNIKDRRYNQLKLAELYCGLGRNDSALKLLREVDTTAYAGSELSSNDDSLELQMRSVGAYARYYKAIGNYAQAFEHLEQFHKLQELKSDRIQKIKVNGLEVGVSNAGHERQILQLQTDKKIRNQRTTILILIIVLSGAGIIIIYYYMRVHKLNSEKLMAQNHQIISQSTNIQRELQHKIDTDKANYLALLENTDESLWSMDKDLNILAFNKVYKEFIYVASGKYPRVGEPDILKELAPSFYSKILTGYSTALAGNTYNSIDKGIKTNGVDLDFATRFNPVKNTAGDVIGITCSRKDITEYFNLTDSLKRNTEQFKNIAFLQSHALRGPLTTIMGISALLSDDKDKLDPDTASELIKGMQEKLEEMDRLVNEIVKLTY